jgi:type III restriction enzyme
VYVTATRRDSNGAIFVQTVSDYPPVEAIARNVVKQPVLPDAASRAKLAEHKSPSITEKYADYLQLGIEEWRKSCVEHEKPGKKAVLFMMVDHGQSGGLEFCPLGLLLPGVAEAKVKT